MCCTPRLIPQTDYGSPEHWTSGRGLLASRLDSASLHSAAGDTPDSCGSTDGASGFVPPCCAAIGHWVIPHTLPRGPSAHEEVRFEWLRSWCRHRTCTHAKGTGSTGAKVVLDPIDYHCIAKVFFFQVTFVFHRINFTGLEQCASE